MKILAYGSTEKNRLTFALRVLDKLNGGVLIDYPDMSKYESMPKVEAQVRLAAKSLKHRSLAGGMVHNPVIAIDHYLDIPLLDDAVPEVINCWWPIEDYDWAFFLGDVADSEVVSYADTAAEIVKAYGE